MIKLIKRIYGIYGLSSKMTENHKKRGGEDWDYLRRYHSSNCLREMPRSRKVFLTICSGTGDICVWSVMGRFKPSFTHFSCPPLPFVPSSASLQSFSKRNLLKSESEMLDNLTVFMPRRGQNICWIGADQEQSLIGNASASHCKKALLAFHFSVSSTRAQSGLPPTFRSLAYRQCSPSAQSGKTFWLHDLCGHIQKIAVVVVSLFRIPFFETFGLVGRNSILPITAFIQLIHHQVICLL